MLMEELLIERTDATGGPATAVGGGSAASWPAIIAGAFVAAGSSLILLTLGSGLGFAAVSPWGGHGMSATAFTATTAIWLIVTQWISASLGGYIAGRLRTRWNGTHVHEVFFRDTAHGLVTWAVATVAIAALLGSSLYAVVGTGVRAAQPPAIDEHAVDSYAIDRLFRPAASAAVPAGDVAPDVRADAAHIRDNAAATGNVPDADRTYLADMIVARTGITHGDAQARVDAWATGLFQAEARAKETADTARKAAAQAAIYIALSLLVGAFIASVSAALGGRLRDEHL